ncbi:MAG: ArsR family transcriptional regulator [Haloarculaceae archaeon]
MMLFGAYDVVMTVASAIGLSYLLIAELDHPDYRWPILVTTFGVLAFAVTVPLTDILLPSTEHAVHALVLSIIVVGLAGFVDASHHSTDWAHLLTSEPGEVRRSEAWMTPLDHRILGLFHSTNLVLTPAIIAYNLEYSRESVNRRLSELVDEGYVDRIDRGKYQLSANGAQYLRGVGPSDDEARLKPE